MKLKRIFDIIFALFLLFFLSPLFVVISFLVKLTSSGEVFFKQIRVGYKQEKFVIYKFRTMYQHTKGSLVTISGDSRITPLGRILRKIKLDEIPQLFNVLVGNMSIVGPRPEVETYIKYYPELSKKIIFSVKPGITDVSSICLFDEEDILKKKNDLQDFYINSLIPLKIKMAIWYVEHQNIWLDFYLVVLTVEMILNKLFYKFKSK